MSNLYYFAADGSYGQWQPDSLLANVEEWTDEEWQRIEEASDYERVAIAYEIELNHARRRQSESPF